MALQGGWGFFRNSSSGEILLRLTYKSYVEDEEEEGVEMEFIDADASDDEMLDYEQANNTSGESKIEKEREPFMNVLAALLVSEEFQGIVSSENGFSRASEESRNSEPTASRSVGGTAENSLESETKSEGPRGICCITLG